MLINRHVFRRMSGLEKEDQTRVFGSAKPLFVKNSIMEQLKKYLVNIL